MPLIVFSIHEVLVRGSDSWVHNYCWSILENAHFLSVWPFLRFAVIAISFINLFWRNSTLTLLHSHVLGRPTPKQKNSGMIRLLSVFFTQIIHHDSIISMFFSSSQIYEWMARRISTPSSHSPPTLPPQYTITTSWEPNLDIYIPESICDELLSELTKPFPLPVLKVSQRLHHRGEKIIIYL